MKTQNIFQKDLERERGEAEEAGEKGADVWRGEDAEEDAQQDEELFVQEIDRQHTLHRVAVYVRLVHVVST